MVVKSRKIVKCSFEETFGWLISKAVPEFQEERIKTIVLLIFQFQRLFFGSHLVCLTFIFFLYKFLISDC